MVSLVFLGLGPALKGRPGTTAEFFGTLRSQTLPKNGEKLF
jgi:hypothetical protein